MKDRSISEMTRKTKRTRYKDDRTTKTKTRRIRHEGPAEINYDKVSKVRGMDITIVTSARNDQQGLELLKKFNLPINI